MKRRLTPEERIDVAMALTVMADDLRHIDSLQAKDGGDPAALEFAQRLERKAAALLEAEDSANELSN